MINVNLLPKNLRRRVEPGYWKLIAVAFPLLVMIVAIFMQFSANQLENKLTDDKSDRQRQLALLQDDIRKQQELQTRQRQLNELIAIANAVRDGRIVWSNELFAMLETLPPRDAGQPRVSFNQLTMRALDENTRQRLMADSAYEGKEVLAEMDIQGSAISTEALAEYIRALENSTLFEVSFQSASHDQNTDIYQFNLTVGALAEGRDEP